MAYQHLILDIDKRGVASVTLNRPEIRNAFDAQLIAELTQVFTELDASKNVRLAVLSGNGKSFCAGGDINWMRAMKAYSHEENIADSKKLAEMFATIQRFSAPLIGVVHGAAMGGGSGLAAVCDFVIAEQDTKFAFSEARIGIVPSVISPYVIEKIGASAARAYFLSGASFDAATAYNMGLAHRVVAADMLEKTKEDVIGDFLLAGPEASLLGKALIRSIIGNIPANITELTMQTIAGARISDEGQEGMSALLEKRKPKWAPQ